MSSLFAAEEQIDWPYPFANRKRGRGNWSVGEGLGRDVEDRAFSCAHEILRKPRNVTDAVDGEIESCCQREWVEPVRLLLRKSIASRVPYRQQKLHEFLISNKIFSSSVSPTQASRVPCLHKPDSNPLGLHLVLRHAGHGPAPPQVGARRSGQYGWRLLWHNAGSHKGIVLRWWRMVGH